jgi:hypothetical protein
MPHLILLGDSIFDNASYVPDRPPVIEQVGRALPAGWRASLLAVDGHFVTSVAAQLEKLPADATHLFVSAGGNDALSSSWILAQPVLSVMEALRLLQDIRLQFRDEYRQMLRAVAVTGLPAVVCTVYDSVPGLGPAELAALAGFNEIILREAFSARLGVIDLRLVCTDASDYSHVSAIEPSAAGGLKIARLIAEIATSHDFDAGRSVVYH